LAKLLILSLDVLLQKISPPFHYDFSLRAIMIILNNSSTLNNVKGHDGTFILKIENM
jgi:hypothetical protein